MLHNKVYDRDDITDSEHVTETIISIGTTASGTSITNHTERRGLGERRQAQSAALPFGERRGRGDRRNRIFFEQRCQDIPNFLNLLDHGGLVVRKQRRRMLVASGLVSIVNGGLMASVLAVLLGLSGFGSALMGYFDKALVALKPMSQALQPLLDVARAQGMNPAMFGRMLEQHIVKHHLLRRWATSAALAMLGRGAGGFWSGAASLALLGIEGGNMLQQGIALGNGLLGIGLGVQQAWPQIQQYYYHFSPAALDTRINEAITLLHQRPQQLAQYAQSTLVPKAQHLAQSLARQNHVNEAAAALNDPAFFERHPRSKSHARDTATPAHSAQPTYTDQRRQDTPQRGETDTKTAEKNSSSADEKTTTVRSAASNPTATTPPTAVATAHHTHHHQHAGMTLPNLTAQLSARVHSEVAARLNNYSLAEQAVIRGSAMGALSSAEHHLNSSATPSAFAIMSTLDAQLDSAEAELMEAMKTFAATTYSRNSDQKVN